MNWSLMTPTDLVIAMGVLTEPTLQPARARKRNCDPSGEYDVSRERSTSRRRDFEEGGGFHLLFSKPRRHASATRNRRRRMEVEKRNRLGSGDERSFVTYARSGESLVTTFPVWSVDMRIASNAWLPIGHGRGGGVGPRMPRRGNDAVSSCSLP